MATTISNPLVVEFVHAAPGALNFTPTRQLRVFDAIGRVTTQAAVATSFRISNVANNITDAASLGNNTADLLGRAGTIDDAFYVVAQSGTLRSTLTGAGTAAIVYVYCYGA